MGGGFNDRFVDRYRRSQQWSRSSALNQMIIFEDYVKQECPESLYIPLQMAIGGNLSLKKRELARQGLGNRDPKFFEDHTKFSNSFRIIAKQNSFKKRENLFVLDSDFDVFYTLQPDAEYQRRLDAFRKKNGRDPLGYTVLDECCEAMCAQIHTQMKTLPMVQKYFSMLGIINFLSSYFMTLKSHGTVPYLEPMILSEEEQKRCPALFPELPITSPGKTHLHPSAIMEHLRMNQAGTIVTYLETSAADELAALESGRPQNASESSRAILAAEVKGYMRRELMRDKRPGEAYSALAGIVSGAMAYAAATAATVTEYIPYRRIDYRLPPTSYRSFYIESYREGPVADTKRFVLREGAKVLKDTRFKKVNILPRFSDTQVKRIALATLAATGAAAYGIYRGSYRFTAAYAYQQRQYTGEAFEETLDQIANMMLEELVGITDKVIELQIQSEDRQKVLSHRLAEMARGLTPKNIFFLAALIKSLEEGVSDFSPVTNTTIFSDSDPKAREISRSVVGGCGMAIPGKPLQDSKEGQNILDHYWPALHRASPESWTVTGQSESGKRYAGFHLQIAQAPVGQEGYQYMEHLLQSEEHDAGKLQRFHELLAIMSSGQSAVSPDSTIREQFLEKLEVVAPSSWSGMLLHNCVTEKTRDRMGRTLLHGSALLEDLSFSRELLRRGFAAYDRDAHGFLPIHYAAMGGHVEQIFLLYSWGMGGTLSAQSRSGATPLIVAIQSGHLPAVQALIKKDPFKESMDVKLAGGYTPLLCALHEGQTDIIHYFLNEKKIYRHQLGVNEPTGRGITPLMLAAELQDPSIVQKLLDKGADPDAEDQLGNKALNIAIKHRDFATMQKLSAITSYTRGIGQHIGKYASANFCQVFLMMARPPSSAMIPMMEEAVEEGNEAVAITCFNYFKQIEPVIREIAEPSPSVAPREMSKKAQNRRLLPLVHSALAYNFSQLAGAIITHFAVQIDCSEGLGLIHRTDGTLLPQLSSMDGAHQDIFRSALKHKNSALFYNLLQHMGIPQQDRPGFQARFGREKSCATIWELPAALKEIREVEGPFAGWTVPHYLIRMDEPHLLFDNFPEQEMLFLRLGGQEGKTLAYIAAEEGNLLALHSLVDKMREADMPFDRQYRGKHLLYGAFESFQGDVIDQTMCLFQKQIDISLDLSTGVRAVHLAAERNLVVVLKQISDYRADFQALDHAGHSALYYAIRGGSSEAVDFLLAKRCPLTEEDMRKAQSMAGNRAAEILQKLLKAGGTLPPQQTSPIEVLSQEELRQLAPFFEAIANQTLGRLSEDEIGVLPLERILPETHTKIQEPLPIIFDLVCRCVKDKLMSIDQLLKFLAVALRKNPDIRDPEGSTFSHYLIQLDIPATAARPQEVTGNFDVHVRNSRGITPLHLAAAFSSANTFAGLLQLAELNVDIEDNDGQTPLFYAIKEENFAAVTALLAKGANPNHRSHRHFTPLIAAITSPKKKSSQVIKKLLSVCDIEQYCSYEKITPLHLLAYKDPDGLFIEALARTARLTYSEDRRRGIAHVLAQEGKLKALRFLAHKDRKAVLVADREGFYPWDYAAHKGQIDILIFYKEVYPQLFSADQNRKADKMLREAAQGGQKKTAKWLVDQGILEHMSRKKQKDALRAAAISNSPETFRFFADLFMKMGGDYFIPTGAFEILPSMVAHESTNSLKYLYDDLEFPKDSEAIYPVYGAIGTGLQLAVESGAFKSTQWLLSHGEDPQKVVENNRMHPLEIGAKNPSFAQFRHLLEAVEFPMNFQNQEDQQTLVHIAATYGNLQHVALLIDKGWDVNIRDRYKLAALDRAVVQRRADIARTLMLCGADEESIDHARGILGSTVNTDLDKTLELYHETKQMFHAFDTVRMQNLATSARETNLHLAIRLGCKTSTLLLATTDLLETTDAGGNTPLHLAVAEGKLAFVRILIDNGASPKQKNAQGQTPFELAPATGNKGIISFCSQFMNSQREALA